MSGNGPSCYLLVFFPISAASAAWRGRAERITVWGEPRTHREGLGAERTSERSMAGNAAVISPLGDIRVSGVNAICIQDAEVGDPARHQMLWPLRLSEHPGAS